MALLHLQHSHQACFAQDIRGKAKEGSSKITWRSTDGGERNATDGKDLEYSSISVMVKDRLMWRDHVAALHATCHNGHE